MSNEETFSERVSDGGVELLDRLSGENGDGSSTANQARKNGQAKSANEERQQFLLEAVRRKPLLDALHSSASSATELSESIDLSRSTVHRATNTLEDHHLVNQKDGKYELTSLGSVIAEKVGSFGEEVWTAVTLEPFLNTIDADGIPIKHFVDATVTRPQPRQPHISIQRIVELVENSNDLKMLSTVLSPIYVDVGYREMMDGMGIEAVFDREAFEIMVSQYAEQAEKSIRSGKFDVYAHEGLPFELFIFDDRIGMAAHDGSGIAKILVECDAPEAIEWAKTVYDEHRAEAEPLLVSNL